MTTTPNAQTLMLDVMERMADRLTELERMAMMNERRAAHFQHHYEGTLDALTYLSQLVGLSQSKNAAQQALLVDLIEVVNRETATPANLVRHIDSNPLMKQIAEVNSRIDSLAADYVRRRETRAAEAQRAAQEEANRREAADAARSAPPSPDAHTPSAQRSAARPDRVDPVLRAALEQIEKGLDRGCDVT